MATAALSVTISTASNMGEKQSAERRELVGLLEKIAQTIGGGTILTEASFANKSGTVVGSWTYTPGAAS
jgi:hypothetical protein